MCSGVVGGGGGCGGGEGGGEGGGGGGGAGGGGRVGWGGVGRGGRGAVRCLGGGGALFFLSIHPVKTDEFFVSCDMGELFHPCDYGRTYTQVASSELVCGHDSKVCFKASPGLLYSINYANNLIVPVKSADGGQSWSDLTGNPDPSEQCFGIYADYDNAQRIIIAYYGQLYISQNGGGSLLYSTQLLVQEVGLW